MDGRTWATLNALPHSTNSGGIKIAECPLFITAHDNIDLAIIPSCCNSYFFNYGFYKGIVFMVISL